MPDRPEYVSLFYGPHLLVACTDEYAQFEGTQEELLNSLRPAGMRMPCTFTATLSGKRIIYRPICDVVDEKFNGYTIVSNPVPFHVVDQVVIGDEISEAAHNMECSHSHVVETECGTAIYADYPGYLSFVFKTIPDKQMWLRCYYQDHGVFKLYPEEKMEFNQCFRFELSGKDAGEWEEFSVQTLNEREGEPLTDIYYPLRIDDEKVHIRISGCPYEGEKRGTGKFYQKIEVGYFEK